MLCLLSFIYLVPLHGEVLECISLSFTPIQMLVCSYQLWRTLSYWFTPLATLLNIKLYKCINSCVGMLPCDTWLCCVCCTWSKATKWTSCVVCCVGMLHCDTWLCCVCCTWSKATKWIYCVVCYLFHVCRASYMRCLDSLSPLVRDNRCMQDRFDPMTEVKYI